ncbi:MAG TPA: hypothetical protein DCQ83_06415 [Fibrobacteres bacterium]|jgi:hypothetical protein|nr:hypothetical protein [Fibrobacterota bacterium]
MRFRHWLTAPFLLVVCFANFWGCAGSKPVVQEGRYSSGKLHYRIEIDTGGLKHGLETWWYDGVIKRYEATNEHGLRNGEYQAWFSDGKPWYKGRDIHGIAQDSLYYWYPNGNLQTVTVFRDGRQIHFQAYDSVTAVPLDTVANARAKWKHDSIAAVQRRQGIEEWSGRVRATVESYWSIPKELARKPYRSVATLRIGRIGDLRALSWKEKSSSTVFNTLADRALKKVRRFPPFPPTIPEAELEIQYEFVSQGKVPKRVRLELHGQSEPDSTD